MANVTGTNARNILRGTNLADIVAGLGGNDDLFGYAGVDRLYGGTGNDRLLGGTGNDFLYGEAGNDILSGDAGIDRLYGGAGNDTYVLGADRDVVGDTAGIDRITSTVSRNLAGYATIENLLLQGSATISGIGNALDNIIIGNRAANLIDGGMGSDRLYGGLGNDTYALTSGTDTVVDTGGVDTITSTASRSLSLYSAIERLTLLGSAAIDGSGNALSNIITGNGGSNTLFGLGGNDTLLPGGGANTLDGGSGLDTVSYANAPKAVTVNLTTGLGGDEYQLDHYLNTESIRGSAFNDYLTLGAVPGGTVNGGAGSDHYFGSPAANVFCLERLTLGTDTIDTFVQGSDLLRVSASEFGIGPTLAADQIYTNVGDRKAKPQFRFDPFTDELYFDPDGTGTSDEKLVVRFDDSIFVTLHVSDFDIVA